MLRGNPLKDSLDILTEAHVQHFVRFIQDYHIHLIHLQCMAAHMIHNTSRGPDNNLDTAL